MTFNVENLFDTQHDPNKEDFTYLPQALKGTAEVKNFCNQIKSPYYRRDCHDLDWNESLLNKKMENIKKAILQVDGGQGPDILVLVEVENDRVLTRLNKDYLAAAGYKSQVLIEGQDPRGIDVAVLSRFPMEGPPVLHKIPFKPEAPEDKDKGKILRGILEVTLRLPDKTKITVFAAHFPSQQNPRYWRAQYVDTMAQLITERSKKNPVLAAGDFNITATEENEVGFFAKKFDPIAYVSHFIGCEKCPGSHKYRDSWSFLDVILFSKDLGPQGKTPWIVRPETIDVPRSQKELLLEDGSPRRFEEEDGSGVSDHFPIYVRLAPRKK